MRKTIILSLISLQFLACSNVDDGAEEEVVLGDYQNGILITNEGNYGSPNASVSFLDSALSSIENQLFQSNNEAESLGDVLQSIAFHENLAFLVLNNSNKVEVVNRYTFERVATLTQGLEQPRYAAVSDGKLFVTNALSDKVTYYDVTSFGYLGEIALEQDIEQVIALGHQVFVQQSYFGNGNSLAVINSETADVQTTITLQNAFDSMVSDGQNIYALCNPENDAKLLVVNADDLSVSRTLDLGDVQNAVKIREDNGNVYFVESNKVYRFEPTSDGFDNHPLFEVTDNSWSTFYGFSVIDDRVYSGDAQGFTQNGTVQVFDLTGSLLGTFVAGVGVNGFYKN